MIKYKTDLQTIGKVVFLDIPICLILLELPSADFSLSMCVCINDVTYQLRSLTPENAICSFWNLKPVMFCWLEKFSFFFSNKLLHFDFPRKLEQHHLRDASVQREPIVCQILKH